MADAVLDLGSLGTPKTPVESTTPETPEQSTAPEVPQQTTPEAKTDGRVGVKEHREAARAAAEALPEHAQAIKEMAAASFRLKAYQDVFAKPEEAIAAKQMIEGIGGAETIAEFQQRIQGYDAQETGLESGDPAVLDSFFEDYPQGAAMLAPHYLSKLEASNPQALMEAVAPYALGMLEQAGVANHLKSMLSETDPERVKGLTQQLITWLEQQKQGVTQKTQPTKQDDGMKAERAKIAEEREQLFSTGVQQKVNSSVMPKLTQAIDQYAKQYKLSETQKKHYAATLQTRLVDQMNADQTYTNQVAIRKQNKARTHDTVADYISGEFNRRIPETALAVAQEIYGKAAPQVQGNGVVKPETPQAAPNGGPIKVSQRPSDSEFADYPGLAMDIIAGRAKLKSGRYVAWR